MGSYTPKRNLYKPSIREKNWGEKVNQNFDILDDHKHPREDITDFFSAPFWQNIPDKPRFKKGIKTITGNGSTTEFEVRFRHSLPSDKLVVSISTTKPTTGKFSYIFAYLEDEDNDGFRETVVITVKFDTPPADGEVVEIYYIAIDTDSI
ncbi:hypothetical protein J7J18_02290 [bacterium]|nr:hypothetical protein [bacterium]